MRPICFLLLIVITAGCSEIKDMKYRQAVLADMARTNAAPGEVVAALPGNWIKHTKDSERGKAFGEWLAKNRSQDLIPAQKAWLDSDFALYHTSESVVTIVFIKTNVVVQYYVGIQ